MEEIATRNGGGTQLARAQEWSDLHKSLTILRQTLPAGGFAQYLRMGKDGRWIYGAEPFDVEPGSKWAIDPLSIRHGYVSWSRYPEGDKRGNEKLGEVMVRHNEDLPNPATLKDTGFPWMEQVSFSVACVSGDDTGEQTLYTTTSYGGMQEVKERLLKALLEQIEREAEKGPIGANSKVVPIVLLESGSYNHTKWGKTYTPSFRIVDWATPVTTKLEEKPQQAAQKAQPEPAPWDPPAAAPDGMRRRRPRL
jgi:hypothetical protein